MLPKLNLPLYTFRFQNVSGKIMIFDVVRKKFVALTPEEWVRQNFVQYLIHEKKFPPIRMAMETGLMLNKMQKRSDIIIHRHDGSVLMLVECKATSIIPNEEIMQQALRYNSTLKAAYIVLTTGLWHHCSKVDFENGTLNVMDEVPAFGEI